jgi:hypothetical protein
MASTTDPGGHGARWWLIQSLSRRVAVCQLLFDHFFGRGAHEQRAVVTSYSWGMPAGLRPLLEAKLRSLR